MKWEGREESDNVEDRRGGGFPGGGGGMLAGGGGLIVLIIALVLGVNPQRLTQFLGSGNANNPPRSAPGPIQQSPEDARLASLTKVVFHDTELVWGDLFDKMNRHYVRPTLVLFSGQVQSACGMADAAVGPFYCGGDEKVYIDLSFYQDMERKLHAPGDFARAYVVAHEVGHHVQALLGYAEKAHAMERSGNAVLAHQASVRLELQADYFAGVWAHYAQEKFHYLEKGDMESALRAAFEIGDDRLQKKATGTVVPEKFTHGTSKQRMFWFNRGFTTGDVKGAAALFELPYEKL